MGRSAQLNLRVTNLPPEVRTFLSISSRIPDGMVYRPTQDHYPDEPVEIAETKTGKFTLLTLTGLISIGLPLAFVAMGFLGLYFMVFVKEWSFTIKDIIIRLFGIGFFSVCLLPLYAMYHAYRKKHRVHSERFGIFFAPDYLLVRETKRKCDFIPLSSVSSISEIRFKPTGRWNAGLKITVHGKEQAAPYGYLISPDAFPDLSFSDVKNWAPDLYQGVKVI